MNSDKKKLYVRTFGCQMNIRDSEIVTGILIDDGFEAVRSAGEADVVLFNSCSVRKHAEDRLFSNIADLAKLKKTRPDLIIGLIGCTAQNYRDKVFEKAPLVDFVCGPGNEADLPSIIRDVLKNRCAIVAADKVNQKRPEPFPAYRESGFKAYVSISEGCDNFCSYCVVPYVRGKERSREAGDIMREVQDLADRGFKEITLLGQNVNSYGNNKGQNKGRDKSKDKGKDKGMEFVRLLERLNNIKGIERIRFMTSHPKDASPELFKAMRDMDKLCEHLHLPLQSGSDRVLRLMNRGYTAKKYLKLAEDYRKILPEGSITTDIIVGFPSESDGDFRKTEGLMRRISFDSAFIFKYSPRPPAKAAALRDNVPADTKQRRLKRLLDMQCAISLERNKPYAGRTVEVLVDGKNTKEPGCVTGRSRTSKVVIFKGDEGFIGRTVSVKVESVSPHGLRGRME